jgi:hypothetical protein
MRITAELRSRPSSARRQRIQELVSPSGLFLAAVMVLAIMPVTRTIQDPDFWWHLRAGQLILAKGALLGTDPFTYTVASHHWTMHEWLSEALFALAQRAGGLGSIVLIFTVVTWLGLLCLLLRSFMRTSNRFVLGLGLLVAAFAGNPIWGPRAQMLTFCFSALTLLLVERQLLRGGRGIWLLLPVFLLWSNLHSGFIIGLGFIAAIIVAELAGGALRMPDPAPRARLATLALVLLGCTAMCLINPNGPGILVYAFQTQGSPAQQAMIQEWFSPNFHDWETFAFGLMLLTLVGFIVANRRLRARDAALVVLTTALALQSVRHIALFVAAVTPIWIDQAAMLAGRRRARPSGAARRNAGPPLGFRVLTFALLVTVLTLVAVAGRVLPSMRLQPFSLVYAKEFPVCAARWLGAAPQPLRIFNQYGEGGYLAYQLSGKGDKVFIFGDAALMGDRLLYSYASVEDVRPNWDATIRNAGTDIVVFDTGTPLANVMAQSPRWTMVYRDPHNVAFVESDRRSEVALPPPPAYAPGDPCARLNALRTPSEQESQ